MIDNKVKRSWHRSAKGTIIRLANGQGVQSVKAICLWVAQNVCFVLWVLLKPLPKESSVSRSRASRFLEVDCFDPCR